jgi:hypothetical protein
MCRVSDDDRQHFIRALYYAVSNRWVTLTAQSAVHAPQNGQISRGKLDEA